MAWKSSHAEWQERPAQPTGEVEELVVTVYGGDSPDELKIICQTEVLTDIVLCGEYVKEWRLREPLIYQETPPSDLWINKVCVSQPRVFQEIIPLKETPQPVGCPIKVSAGQTLTIDFQSTVLKRFASNEKV